MDAFHRTGCVDAPNAFGGWTEQTRCINGIITQNRNASTPPHKGTLMQRK